MIVSMLREMNCYFQLLWVHVLTFFGGGGGGRGVGPMLPILQPCFMTLIQFVLHTEFSNFLITNIVE